VELWIERAARHHIRVRPFIQRVNMRLRVFSIIGLCLALLSGCRSEHEAAIERFAEFAEGGLKAKGKETRALFYGCFRKGDSAEIYARAFQSASKEPGSNDGNGPTTIYKWRWTGERSPNHPSMDEHAFLIVVAGGYDNKVLDVYHKYHPYDNSWGE
jgi:hypothetical protein